MLGERLTPGKGVAARRRVGALVEEPAFWRYRSGRKNLEYFARAAGQPRDRPARLGRLDESLDLVGLSDAAGKKVRAYSQGMRQARQRPGRCSARRTSCCSTSRNGMAPPGHKASRSDAPCCAAWPTCRATVFVSSHLLPRSRWPVTWSACWRAGRLVAEGPPPTAAPCGERLRVAVDDPVRARKVLAGARRVTVDTRPETRPAPAPLRVTLARGAGERRRGERDAGRAGLAVSELTPEHEPRGRLPRPGGGRSCSALSWASRSAAADVGVAVVLGRGAGADRPGTGPEPAAARRRRGLHLAGDPQRPVRTARRPGRRAAVPAAADRGPAVGRRDRGRGLGRHAALPAGAPGAALRGGAGQVRRHRSLLCAAGASSSPWAAAGSLTFGSARCHPPAPPCRSRGVLRCSAPASTPSRRRGSRGGRAVSRT